MDVCQTWVGGGRVPSFHPRMLGFGRSIAVTSMEEHVPTKVVALGVGWRREKRVEFDNSADDLCQEWLQDGSICTTTRAALAEPAASRNE